MTRNELINYTAMIIAFYTAISVENQVIAILAGLVFIISMEFRYGRFKELIRFERGK